MSESTNKSNGYTYYASGVFKIDMKSAGYKELMAIAKEWSNDPNFYHLEIRHVSESNLGIQFVYYTDTLDYKTGRDVNGPIVTKYRQELVDKYGAGVYARDFTQRNTPHTERVIVSKGLN